MRAITWNGAAAWLLDDWPDWSQGFELSAEQPVHVERGLTQRLYREPLAATLRLSCGYRATVSGAALRALRDACNDLAEEPVLCPLWAYPLAAGASPTVLADYWLVGSDPATATVEASTGIPFGSVAHPLMVGRLQDAPNLSVIGPDSAQVTFRFRENSTRYLTFPSHGLSNGPTVGSETSLLWGYRPNWANELGGGLGGKTDLVQPIGELREHEPVIYAQPAVARFEQGYTLTDAQPWQVLRAFQDLCAASLWVPEHTAEGRLAANVTAIATTLTLDNVDWQAENTYLLLDDLENRVAVKVTSDDGAGVYTLSGAVGTAFDKRVTSLFPLRLARWRSNSLTLQFASPAIAQLRCTWEDLPWELDTAHGETIGADIGEGPQSAYIYHFFLDAPETTKHWWFTNYESALTWDAKTCTPGAFEHGDIVHRLGLTRDTVSLRSRMFTGNPLGLMLPFRCEYPLRIEIIEAQLTGQYVAEAYYGFRGEVVSLSAEGPTHNAQCKTFSRLLDRRIPRMLYQRTCNWTVFEPRCGLSAAAWRFAGVVAAWDSTTCELTVSGLDWLGTGDRPTISADWLAGGSVKVGSAPDVESRVVMQNAAESGGSVVLTVGTPLQEVYAVGSPVRLLPGCNGAYSTCLDKFGNGPRFGGFPHLPIGNQLLPNNTDTGPGGKKA